MDTTDGIFIGGSGDGPQHLSLRLANRHGLITGATGTGKTVTLQVLAEGFSNAGVPVFLADVKGDLSGMAVPGAPHPKIAERAATIGLGEYTFRGAPVVFWDLFGENGHPVRTTVSEMGPLLLSRLLDLTEVQEGVLAIAFQVADDEGMLLLDLKDLRALITHVADNAAAYSTRYGNVTRASAGAIQRRLLVLEQQGGGAFFGEPALDLRDFMRTELDGRGCINVLDARRLMQSPRVYATFLLWLLAELFEELPEVGDPDRPRLVFFFDEAHLLFEDAPKALVDKVEQVVRLIRSKGVGVYFITQNPLDVPDGVLSQLGNRVQHALRAFTRREQKAVKASAETFRANPAFDTAEVMTQLGTGEALVSVLEKKGSPTMVARTLIRPPASRIGPASEAERAAAFAKSPVAGRYDTPVDRESAYEILAARAEEKAEAAAREQAAGSGPRDSDRPSSTRSGRRHPAPQRRPRMSTAEKAMREVGRTVGRELVRGLFGVLFGKRR